MGWTPWRWVRPGRALSARLLEGREFGLRTAKTTLAAVLSYVVADHLHTSPGPVLAPLTALLVVQLTMYETVEHGLERVVSVVAGVLVAVGVATFVGLTWWSLGALIALSLVVGELVRLGPHLLEVPITAMLILAVGGAETAALGRVYETLIGAAAGILVNALIVPPLYVRPAGEAIGDLADRMARYLRGLAAQLREGWSVADAEHWLAEARALGAEVLRADQSLARAEQSARLNPRGGAAREALPRLRTALTGLEHCYVSLRQLARGMYERTVMVADQQGADAYGPEARAVLAEMLERAAEALTGVVGLACGAASAEAARARVAAQAAELHRLRHRLSELLLVDPYTDQGAWQQHGALLAAIDRVRVEVESAVRPARMPWRPHLEPYRQRQAVRRVMDAAAQAAVELRPILPSTRIGTLTGRRRLLKRQATERREGVRRRPAARRLVRDAIARLPGWSRGRD